MKKLISLTAFLVLLAGAQDDLSLRNTTPAAENVNSLYQRASASRFVTIGVVTNIRSVMSRKSKAALDRIMATGKDDPDFQPTRNFGLLYTITIEQTLCRQTDFQSSPVQVLQEPIEVQMFVPQDCLMCNVERPQLNVHELFFLVPSADQKQWLKQFDLDRSQTYYQAEWRGDGVISLSNPGPEPPILSRITQLCEAVRPSDPAQKTVMLDRLVASGDPVLQKEAAEAKQALVPKTAVKPLSR